MKLPIEQDMEPMLSAPADLIPAGDSWEYEPKWDGFRTLVFRDGDEVELVSRGGRPMTRYFPELPPAFRGLREQKVVLDGELVVVGKGGLDFGALQQRIHPADSRVRMLSAGDAGLVRRVRRARPTARRTCGRLPLGERRKRLEALLKGVKSPIFLTPYTRDRKTADRLVRAVRGRRSRRRDREVVDGHLRAGQAAVGEDQAPADGGLRGHRLAQDQRRLDAGRAAARPLRQEGHDALRRPHLVLQRGRAQGADREAEAAADGDPRGGVEANPGRMPGGLSRWSRGKDTEWVSVRPELVCEVTYDKLEAGERFRHATGFLRWRTDKPPKKCGFDQIASAAEFDVRGIFRSK